MAVVNLPGKDKMEIRMQERIAELEKANQELLAEIFERKQAEEKFRYHANLIDNVSDAIISTDRELKIKSWNRAAERIYGWKADEVIGMKGSDILRTTFPERLSREAIAREIFEKGSWEGELVQRTKDGRKINVYGKSVTLKDEAGAVIGGVSIVSDITERKRTEKALKLSNLYNRSLIEASLDPLVTIGPDGKITDVNNSTEIVTGYSRDELIGTDFSDYFTDPEKAKKGYQCAFQKGFVRDYPLEIRHRDGHITPVLYNASVYKDEAGKVTGVFAAARDITAIKKAEEKIHKLANAVESSDDAFITKSLDGIITSWNKGAEKIYGYLAEEVLGKNISMLEPDSTKGETDHLIEKIKQGERIRHYETLRMKKDGTIIDVLVTLSPVFDMSGKLIAISTIARDITERKKAEEALRVSNLYNRSLIEASLDPLVTIGHDGRIMDVNRATEEVTGYSRRELIGTDFSDYFTEPEKASAGYRLVFTSGEVRDYPLEIQHKNGHITPVLYNASVYKDENDKIIGIFAAARDISDLKKAEKALKKAYGNLEEKVKERTAELENAYNSLKESERSLAEAQKLAHAGSFDWNIVTNDEYWSDELYRIFELDPKLKLNHDIFLNCIHPDDLDYVNHAISGALNGKPYHIDYRIILPDGEERIVYSQGGIIFNEKNTPVRMIGIVQDITESKTAQQKLQQSEEKYRFFVQSFKGITFQLDKDLNIEFFHGAVKEITGYEEEEISSSELWTQLVVPEDLEIYLEAEAKAVQSPGDYLGEVEYRINTKNGSIKWVQEIHQKIRNLKGEPLYTGVVYDITEKKEAEESLQNLEVIRKKEIHHRIKNNLQVISSLLDLQAEQFRNREYVKDSEIIEAFRESQDRVTSIALIHEELHEEEGTTDTLNFSQYLQRLLQNLFQTYRFGKIDICLNLDLEENIFFDMDTAVPLGMIVNELVSNSFKYAFSGKKTGEIQIKLCKEVISEPDNREGLTRKSTMYTLIVSDNGTGIPEKIDFENSDTLGLQLVNLLVDQLDGEIELKRDQGTGYIIHFYLEEDEKT
ncbi:PAS domain S-box protein [Methanosarcina hadiensis]|uniref:PAS domain S-box protein n=1 Tax=Methanosarcina hadiensis TaxID=3078083 RepID=UPI003977B7A6